jgi:hypothetical protein
MVRRRLWLCFASISVAALHAHALAEEPAPQATHSSNVASTQKSLEEQVSELRKRQTELEQEVRALKAPPPIAPAETPPGSGKEAPPPPAPGTPEPTGEPFAWGNFTWLNGGTRQTTRLLDSKYFTPQLDVDLNYTYSFNRPIDDTVVGSTALARNNELEISFIGLGGDFHAGKVRARLLLQYGTRTTVVPRNDGSILKGQFDLATAYRYISEGYAGYHFDWLHGVNLDVGIFMSYVGLFSYDNFENWAYQPSYTSDNTPWFFNGARIQIFPTDRLKVEIWLINGWQSYAKFNELPGAGYQIRYAPREWMNMVFNGYVGTDTQDHPGRVRFHSDNSFLLRYYHHPQSAGLSQGAFSVTFDLGFEQGDGVQAFGGSGTEGNCTNATPCEQDFVSAMAYNRLWFYHNLFGWTAGGGFIRNPGRYLVLVPTGVATSTGLLGGFDTNPGTKFDGWDISTTFDWMPTENITFRFELVYRHASVPYFAGRGGVTSPDGYKSGGLASPDGTIFTAVPSSWTPNLVDREGRFIAALIFRI